MNSSAYLICVLLFWPAFGMSVMMAQPSVPSAYGNLQFDPKGSLKSVGGPDLGLRLRAAKFTLNTVTPKVTGEKNGLHFQFLAAGLRNGKLTYGLIPYEQHTYPTAVLRFETKIDPETGAAFLPIAKNLKEGYDHTGWQKNNFGIIGYRLTDSTGLIVYEGKQAFARSKTGFEPRPTVTRGPFISDVTHKQAVIWYETSEPVFTMIKTDVAEDTFFSNNRKTHHEVLLSKLEPGSEYDYTVGCDSANLRFRFRTAVPPGWGKFRFAYASDSRSGYGGGERNVYGTNALIMSRIGALSVQQGAAFMQFTGDLVDGYVSDPDEMRLQMVNWMHAVEPYWHWMPFNVGMGNHESLGWYSDSLKWIVADGFPYATHSGEAVFAEMFVNPVNGPSSEDGAKYDPEPYRRGDFPSYRENVYHYSYGNTTMIVLNTDYWYAPLLKKTSGIGGNLHGYIMDQQLRWLGQLLQDIEHDSLIDHVFVTLHTPLFPNGGHRGDCMWYNGDNTPRPWVAGAPVEKGIIERRDELLDLCVNQSSKVVAFLCGDEHNYNRMLVEENTPRYPEAWDKPRLTLRRPVWQIINGAAGAPFYAQQQLPWSTAVEGFTVQNALCFFDIDGKTITLRVMNPDTLEVLDQAQMH
ncbi:MAG: metallophosphoesterase family protein [Saprospiraceae bacterium]|nr:metallophosphoesterase family protein [Saprospiraceae bacterium]